MSIAFADTTPSKGRTRIVVSLPNSGTTWFCGLLAKHTPSKYADEYFNPGLNHEHEVILRERFGTEFACCYRNIALPADERCDEIIRETWAKSDFTLTKENYSPLKLDLFTRHFTSVIVLLRHTAGVFPPSRSRVWSFYEHAWQAFADAGFPMREVTLRARCMEVHTLMARTLKRDAQRLNVPIVYYEDMRDPELARAQLMRAGVLSQELADDIKATCRPKRIDWDHVY